MELGEHCNRFYTFTGTQLSHWEANRNLSLSLATSRWWQMKLSLPNSAWTSSDYNRWPHWQFWPQAGSLSDCECVAEPQEELQHWDALDSLEVQCSHPMLFVCFAVGSGHRHNTILLGEVHPPCPLHAAFLATRLHKCFTACHPLTPRARLAGESTVLRTAGWVFSVDAM